MGAFGLRQPGQAGAHDLGGSDALRALSQRGLLLCSKGPLLQPCPSHCRRRIWSRPEHGPVLHVEDLAGDGHRNGGNERARPRRRPRCRLASGSAPPTWAPAFPGFQGREGQGRAALSSRAARARWFLRWSPTALVPTTLVPTALVPTALVPTALVPTALADGAGRRRWPTALADGAGADGVGQGAGQGDRALRPLPPNFRSTHLQQHTFKA